MVNPQSIVDAVEHSGIIWCAELILHQLNLHFPILDPVVCGSCTCSYKQRQVANQPRDKQIIPWRRDGAKSENPVADPQAMIVNPGQEQVHCLGKRHDKCSNDWREPKDAEQLAN
jgi:hypothetical protein